MRLATRKPRDEELEWCAKITDDGFERDPRLREYLPSFWRRLLADEAISMVLIEDHEPSPPRRVAFGAFVFVSDLWMATRYRAMQPYLSCAIVDAARRDGSYGGVLGRDAIRRANSGHGLNVLVLNCSEIVVGYSRDDCARIRKRLIDTLIKAAAGYNLKEIVFEFFGKQDLPYLLNAGFVFRSDFAAAFPGAKPPLTAWPVLVGLRRDEAESKSGTRIAELFGNTERRFNFTDSELAVLARAFAGQNDREIGEALGVARNVVMMRWRAIFARVQRRSPSFFDTVLQTGTDQARDAKRRYLLRYLEDYTDELRPAERRP